LKRVFISDCEGPISKNDNAFEITANFIPNGDRLFTVISKYDDVLADVIKKPGYSAGSTLKLILPFLKAYDVTDAQMEDFSVQNLILIPNSKNTLQHIRKIANSIIISTSYEHYIRALCRALEFPFNNTYCTKLSIDKFDITEQEKSRLKELTKEITQMPMITIPPMARTLEDFSKNDQNIIGQLDKVFWSEIKGMRVGRTFSEVSTIGGIQKAASIEDAVARCQVTLREVMYVGDSITDVEAFRLVGKNGGLAVSFNGNGYAVKNSEIAVLSENNLVTAVIADVFCKQGKQATLDFVKNWNLQSLETSKVDPSLLDRLFALHPQTLPKVQIVTTENMETVTKKSNEFRKKVRGEAIGNLG
jgi:energy-converting hydrogenase A subunit R